MTEGKEKENTHVQ